MSWYDGLTFEQVRDALETGKGVPGWDVPGGTVTVPNGYHDWLHRQEQTSWIENVLGPATPEPTRNQMEAELWRRLFAQLDRIEAGLGPRTLPSAYSYITRGIGPLPAPVYADPDPAPRTWQSAFRQLAETLFPDSLIVLDHDDPEACCAALAQAIQAEWDRLRGTTPRGSNS